MTKSPFPWEVLESYSTQHYFKQLAQGGITILISTHYLEEASRCTSVGLMSQGQLLGEGTPQELETAAHAKTLEEAFLTLVGRERQGQ